MIELQNISAGYGKNLILQDISVTFEKGKLISILGVNGCGKSTLLKTLLALLPLRSGEILLDSTSLHTLSRNEIARKIAYLSQGKTTPDMTVEQMVLHGRFPHLSYPRRYTKPDYEIASRAMQQMGITDLAHTSLQALSGGMRQNAYLAMALAQETDYVLLDEPTTYLDISHQLTLMDTLRSLARSGKSIIAVMHDLPMALTFSDQILLLHDGHVICSDTPQQVYASKAIEDIFKVRILRSSDENTYHYQYETRT